MTWDATEKEIQLPAWQPQVVLVFTGTNTRDRSTTITRVQASCDCILIQDWPLPLTLAPGESTRLRVTIDLQGKSTRFLNKGGRLTKTLEVQVEDARPQTLLVHVSIPAMTAKERTQNQALARNDPQAIFKGSCVDCHVTPAQGRKSEALFKAACAICHVSPHRADVVPTLIFGPETQSPDYWRQWITQGKAGTLMTGFAREHGGPLTAEQVESLVRYLVEVSSPKSSADAPHPDPTAP